MENPIKIHDLGVSLFLETPIYTHSNAQQLHGSTESSQSVYFKSFLLFQLSMTQRAIFMFEVLLLLRD